MKKIYKILSLLLVIAAVVCVAGCSSKNTNNATQSSVAAENITDSNATANVPANTEVTKTPTENVTETPTENVTETPTENNTSTPAASGAVHLSTAARHQLLKQQANSTENVTQ
jgi:hypothetical protein